MIYDFATKKRWKPLPDLTIRLTETKWAPDGHRIYFISGINATDQLWVYDGRLRSYPPIRQITSDIGDYTSFLFQQ